MIDELEILDSNNENLSHNNWTESKVMFTNLGAYK